MDKFKWRAYAVHKFLKYELIGLDHHKLLPNWMFIVYVITYNEINVSWTNDSDRFMGLSFDLIYLNRDELIQLRVTGTSFDRN